MFDFVRFLPIWCWIICFCWLPCQCEADGLSAHGLAKAVAAMFNPQTTRPELGKGIQVVSAGFGHGGAVSRAFEALGYSVYDFGRFLRNNSVWDDFLHHRRNTTHLIEMIASEGYNAIAGFPGALLYMEVVTLFPVAKVVLVEPVSSESKVRWANDTLTTVFGIYDLSYRKPFYSFSISKTLHKLFEEWALVLLGLPIVKTNNGKSIVMPRKEKLIQANTKWTEGIKLNVPEDRLLILSSEYKTWQALCDFLAPSSPLIKQRCKSLTNQRFPMDKEKTNFLVIIAAMKLVASCYDRLPLTVLLLVGFVNAIVIWSTYRGRSSFTEKEKSE